MRGGGGLGGWRPLALAGLSAGAIALLPAGVLAGGQAAAAFGTVPLPAGVGYLNSVSCPAVGVCYAAGQTRGTGASHVGLVLALSGGSWHPVRIPGVSYLIGVSCSDTTHCAATGVTTQGDGVVVATSDAISWAAPVQPPPFAGLGAGGYGAGWSVSCAGRVCMAAGGWTTSGQSTSQVWVTGAAAYSSQLQGWSRVSLPPGVGDPARGWLDSVSCDRPGDCWVVGSGIWHTTDAGGAWTVVQPGVFVEGGARGGGIGVLPDSVYFADDQHGLVGGAGECGGPGIVACPGGIWSTEDGGATWRQDTAESTDAVNAVACAPGGTCVATGWASETTYSGRILASSGVGSRWQADGTTTAITLGGVACPAEGGCVVVGGNPATDTGDVYAQGSLLSAGPPAQASTIATSLPSPWGAFGSGTEVALSAAVAAGGALFVTFPANLFNLTFQENYEEIRGWWLAGWRWLRRWGPRHTSVADPASGGEPEARGGGRDAGTPWPVFALVIVGGALLGSLNDPGFGFGLASLATFLGTALAIGVGIGVTTLVAVGYHRRRHGSARIVLRALPAGLAIAVLCVLVSRLTGFEPGYLYGIIAGVAVARELPRHEKGHVVGLTTLSMLVVAVAAWFAWVPVNQAATTASAPFVAVLLDDLLGAVFVSGVVGSVIGMLPLRFLPGWTLKEWRRGAWAALFAVSSFLLVQVMLQTRAGHGSATPLVTTIVLFAVFGSLSVALRELFAHRRRRRRGEATPALRERVRQLLSPVETPAPETERTSPEPAS